MDPEHGPNGRTVADVDRFLADVAAERERRNEELRAAQDRLVVAEARWHVVQAEARLELAQLTAAAEAELVRMEEIHRRAVDAITHAAAQQAAEIVAVVAASTDVPAARRSPGASDG